ncbi:MAG: hypothetical protein U0451_01995 [Candidatus Saccharimonadales bacterium]
MDGGIGQETNIQTTGDKLKQGAAFVGLRYFDNALWLGAAASGIFIQEKTGVPSEVAAPAIAIGVTGVEYAVSGQAVKVFGTGKSEFNEGKLENASNLIKDTLALGYSAWSGSTSTVEFNNSLGLESSKTRRLGQAAIYGIGCSLWTTNLPLFKQGRELVLTGVQEWTENPIEGTAAAGAVSLGVFSIFKGIKIARQKFSEHRQSKAQGKSA